MKKHKYYLIKFLLLLIATVFIAFNVTAQDHTSKDNYTGNWEDAGTWEIGGIPPEPTTNNTQVDIYGTVNRNSLLEVRKDFTLNIHDTLIIYGDFDLAKDGNVNVFPGAFFIVYGNFTSAKDIEIDLNSYLVVFGDFELQKDANITTPAGDTLLYASGSASCVGVCGAVDIGNEDDMFDNPDLDEIIESTSNFITPRSPTLCSGGSLVLSIRDDGNNYEWFETSDPTTILSTESTLLITATGTYDVDFDVGGVAQSVDPVTVTSSGTVAFSISGVVTDASAVGLSDGEIDLTVTPSGTYTYDWSNGEITEDLSGLAAGNYTVEVEDDNCRLTETFSVTDVSCTDPALSTVTTPTICNGSSYDLTNIVVVDANGTSPTYTYHSGTPGLPGNELGSTMVSPTTTTTYYILGTNGNCTDELAVDVTVNPLPEGLDYTPANICSTVAGDDAMAMVDLTALEGDINTDGSGVTFVWYEDAALTSPVADATDALISKSFGGTVSTTEDFYCEVISASNCADVAKVTYTLYRIPETGPQYHISNEHAK